MRKVLISGLFVAGALIVAASPAAAQQTPPSAPPPAVPAPTLAQQRYMATTWTVPWGVRSEYEMFLDEASGNNVTASLERVDLANRVSTLIELGRCTEARTEANAAGDRLMALRARQLCRAPRS